MSDSGYLVIDNVQCTYYKMADSKWMDYTREWRGNQPAKGSMHQTVRARAGISFLVHVILKRALLAIGTPGTL